MDLFSHTAGKSASFGAPLADLLRPENLDDIIGQDNSIGPFSPLGKLLRSGSIPSLIVYGPPGTGKTSFARALAHLSASEFILMNAVGVGVKDLRTAGENAHERRLMHQSRTVLFVDEIHRFNKGQQDVLLPFIECGDLILIGATTENPSYELNRALLSRCRLVNFHRLNEVDLGKLYLQAQAKGKLAFRLEPEALEYLIATSDGDGRRLLNSLELLQGTCLTPETSPLSREQVASVIQKPILAYDKNSQLHYDFISAFIKSIRGSDADAALYWMSRMIIGGEDPSFIARRLVILASEDVGNADPRALTVAVAAAQAVEMIGLPEAEINLAQAVTYLSSCPKSNASYLALKRARIAAENSGSVGVPAYLSAQGKADYHYPHDFPRGWVQQDYLPPEVRAQVKRDGAFYVPTSLGFEKNIRDFIAWLKALNS